MQPKKILQQMLSIRARDPVREFHSARYLRHNARRLEHLASLRIPLKKSWTVLEVGAGIGDHSHYYLDRGHKVTITEGRRENVEHLRALYPDSEVQLLDMESPHRLKEAPYDVVHCYGLLYHLKDPQAALSYISENCRELMLLETCVSFGDEENVNPVNEVAPDPSQAVSGFGCRPTRSWIVAQLRTRFEHVYIPRTQPNHEEFPLDWTRPDLHRPFLTRAVFIASRHAIQNDVLTTELMQQQVRHD